MKALIIGNLTIDKNIVHGRKYIGPGGAAYFVSQTLNNFNLPNLVVSPTGQDFTEKYRKNIKIYPAKPIYSKNLVFHNYYSFGMRRQKVENLSSGSFFQILPLPKKIYSDVKIAIIATIINNLDLNYLKQIKNQLNPSGKVLLIAQGLFRQETKNGSVKKVFKNIDEILPCVDYLVVSDDDLLSPLKWGKNWSKKGPKVIVTHNKSGCSLIKNGKIIRFPAYQPQKNIDSTGAGDIFAAAFIYAKYKGRDDNYSARFANATASISLRCKKNDLCFTEDEVNKLIGY